MPTGTIIMVVLLYYWFYDFIVLWSVLCNTVCCYPPWACFVERAGYKYKASKQIKQSNGEMKMRFQFLAQYLSKASYMIHTIKCLYVTKVLNVNIYSITISCTAREDESWHVIVWHFTQPTKPLTHQTQDTDIKTGHGQKLCEQWRQAGRNTTASCTI